MYGYKYGKTTFFTGHTLFLLGTLKFGGRARRASSEKILISGLFIANIEITTKFLMVGCFIGGHALLAGAL